MVDVLHLRQIRSFVRREGRLSTRQRNAIQDYWPIYGIDLHTSSRVLRERCRRYNEVILEIGFGMGDSLIKMAEHNPHSYFIGIEVHRPGIGNILAEIHTRQVKNISVYQCDAIDVLQQHIPNQFLNRVQIYFPDPWHKKRHHKRRLINHKFVALLLPKLRSTATLHLATDWAQYAEHMLDVLSTFPELHNHSENGDYLVRPSYRPITKFERRGHDLGHQSWDIIFEKS